MTGKHLGITVRAKKNRGSSIKRMKKKEDVVAKPGTLTLHVGTQGGPLRKEPMVHEASVLKQLKTIIEKNQRLLEDTEK